MDDFMEAAKVRRLIKDDIANEKLNKIVEMRIRTSFIGALERFENHFSALWGDCSTDSQKKAKEIYDKCRTAILDWGNLQIRLVRKELQSIEAKFKPRIIKR